MPPILGDEMGKIPVGKTISDAYGFAFGKFLPNLGTVWLPVALAMAAAWFLLMPYFNAMGQLVGHFQPHDPNPMAALSGVMDVYRYVLLFQIIDIALRAQIMLGLTRRAFGQKQMLPFVFFEFGAPFWRLFGAYFIVSIIIIVIYFVLAIGLAIVAAIVGVAGVAAAGGGGSGGMAAGGFAGLLIGLCVLAVIFLMLYAIVRLTFLLTPAIVDEKKLAIFRSWELTRGNFWRSFWIGAAIFVPTVILIDIIAAFFYMPVFAAMLHNLPRPGTLPDPQASARAMQTMMSTMVNVLHQNWYIFVAMALLFSTILYGLAAGAAASAYRSLVPAPVVEA
jgi:hypothetical protein